MVSSRSPFRSLVPGRLPRCTEQIFPFLSLRAYRCRILRSMCHFPRSIASVFFFSPTVHAWSSPTCFPSFPPSVPPRPSFSFLPLTSLACCTDTTASIATSSNSHVRRRVRERSAPVATRPDGGTGRGDLGGRGFRLPSWEEWERGVQKRPRDGQRGHMETSTQREVHHYSPLWMARVMAAQSIHGRGIKTARKLHERPSAAGSCRGSLSKCTSSRTDSKWTRPSTPLR